MFLSTFVTGNSFNSKSFSTEFQWSLFDFLVMAILLTIVGFAIEIIRYKIQNKRTRLILMLLMLLFLFLSGQSSQWVSLIILFQGINLFESKWIKVENS